MKGDGCIDSSKRFVGQFRKIKAKDRYMPSPKKPSADITRLMLNNESAELFHDGDSLGAGVQQSARVSGRGSANSAFRDLLDSKNTEVKE